MASANTMPPPEIDVVVLSRAAAALHPSVSRSISRQRGVRIHLHHIVGEPSPSDRHRWETIARARNLGKGLGRQPWLMFVDDDVELAPSAIRDLFDGLVRRPDYAALAADYLGQCSTADFRRHVSMGATLFRRAALERIRFRWEADRCECQCCCDDLRRMVLGIGYLPGVKARHLSRVQVARSATGHVTEMVETPTGHVLAAFDRSHLYPFVSRFLKSLRRSGNAEPVTAVTYGLLPHDCQLLERSWGARVINRPLNGVNPAIRRLRDFQDVLLELPPNACVAYWDAPDVLFQSTLRPLWRLVQRYPDRLLVVQEAGKYSENGTITDWIRSIRDPISRRWADELTAGKRPLNSGFAAGCAATLMQYFREADSLRHSTAMAGTTDWGDQTAMNLHCYSHPEQFVLVEDDWNYCLCGRKCGEVLLHLDGRIARRSNGELIPVVHGNAKTLEPYWAFHTHSQSLM